jgi:YtkA-like
MRIAALAVALATLTATAAACSTSSTPAGAEDAATLDSSDLVGCDDLRVESFAPAMQQMGASGLFQFVLVSSVPSPPADQTNVFVVEVLDAEGNKVTVALTAVASMPTMNHGTSDVLVTPNADGTYTLQPLYFFMPGFWETAIHVVSGTKDDSTSFYFCVAG